jgi:hypothetical protein
MEFSGGRGMKSMEYLMTGGRENDIKNLVEQTKTRYTEDYGHGELKHRRVTRGQRENWTRNETWSRRTSASAGKMLSCHRDTLNTESARLDATITGGGRRQGGR